MCGKKNSSRARIAEGVVAGRHGWKSDGRSAVDAQDHTQVGRCLAAGEACGKPCDRGSPVAGGEVVVAIEPQAAGWKTGPVSATDSSACWGVADDDSNGEVGRLSAWTRRKKSWWATSRMAGALGDARTATCWTHDFPSLTRAARATRTASLTSITTRSDVATTPRIKRRLLSAVAIQSWWLRVGRHRYPCASRLAIEADSGSAPTAIVVGPGRWGCIALGG